MPEEEPASLFQTRHTLLERIQNRDDQESWKEFISYYEQYIYNILRRINVPSSDADDLSQEVILKLWKKIPELAYNRDKGKFRHWLSTVIRNDVKRFFYNKNKTSRIIENQDDALLTNSEDPLGNLDLEEIIAEEWDDYVSNLAWESVKKHFNETIQQVFILHTQGKSYPDIAEECKIHEGSVRKYISRVRQYLIDEVDIFNKELL
jgi:RNA polymerase sigma factor (sigma-70 family)